MKNKVGDDYLFVYGTLRKAFNLHWFKQIEDDIQWLGLSEIRGALYDLGDYPGAVQEYNSVITGDVFRMIYPKKVLAILDEYEGYDSTNEIQSLFVRQKESILLTNGKDIEAWVYWYNRSVKDKRRIYCKDYLDYIKKNKTA